MMFCFVGHFTFGNLCCNIRAQNKLYKHKLYKIFWLLFPFQIKIAIEPGWSISLHYHKTKDDIVHGKLHVIDDELQDNLKYKFDQLDEGHKLKNDVIKETIL